MEHNGNDAYLYFYFALAVIFFSVLAFYFNFLRPICEEKRYIKLEMQRSYDEKEYRYWKRKLKKLYISSIPLIGKSIIKFIKQKEEQQ